MSMMLTKQGALESLAFAMHVTRLDQERIWRLHDELDAAKAAAADDNRLVGRLIDASGAITQLRGVLTGILDEVLAGKTPDRAEVQAALREVEEVDAWAQMLSETPVTEPCAGFNEWQEARRATSRREPPGTVAEREAFEAARRPTFAPNFDSAPVAPAQGGFFSAPVDGFDLDLDTDRVRMGIMPADGR